MNFTAGALKVIKQYANRRSSSLIKAIASGKVKEPKSFRMFQEWLKGEDKSFRKYNRKKKIYEVIIPRNKFVKQSKKYQRFMSKVNEYVNTSKTIPEEVSKQKVMQKYKMSENVYNRLDLSGYSIGHYSSEDDDVKKAHLEEAIELYNPSSSNVDQAAALRDVIENTDKYSIHEIYDIVANLSSITEGTQGPWASVLDEVASEWGYDVWSGEDYE